MIDLVFPEIAELAPLSLATSELKLLNRAYPDQLGERLRPIGGNCRWSGDFWPAADFVAELAELTDWEVVCGARVVAATSGNGSKTRIEGRGVLICYPWDLLAISEKLVAELDTDRVTGKIYPGVIIEGKIELGAGSKLLPGVFIEGNVVIGRDCKIGPNAYIRGNTVIGDRCHVGQAVEIKNSILGNHVSVGHLSYVGDTVIDDDVNFGAGTIIGNLRHDGANHRSLVGGRLVSTGRRKFGAVIGSGVHTGIDTAIYPGRKIGRGVSTRPGDIVSTDL